MTDTSTSTTTATNITATGEPAATTPAAPATGGDWTSGFSDDVKGYVQNKGFKDPTSLVDSYRNLEKLMGVPQERLLKLPEKADAPEWQQIFDKLGRPSKPEEYGIKIPEKGGNKEFLEGAVKKFHELGMSKAQATKVVEFYDTFVNGKMQAQETLKAENLKAQEANLKKEWGQSYDQNIQAAKVIYGKLGLNEEVVDKLESVMGFDGVMKFIHGIGTKTQMGEDAFVQGQSVALSTPAAKQNKINQLIKDADFQKRIDAKDPVALSEWNSLFN